jgi:hypothetical protein
MYVEGEIPTLTYGNCNNGNGGMWGNDGIWAILLLALLGFGGRGFGGGFGGFGGYGGAGNEFVGYELGKVATQADVASGFNNSAVLSSLNDIKLTQASNLNFINQGFAGLNNVITTGFAGVDNAICTLGYQNQAGFNTLAHQISDCCCATQRAIDSVNYNNAKNTCDIIQAINAGNQKLLDVYTSDKIDTLNRKLAVAEGQISNYAQTNAIVNALKQPCPIPAYTVPNPNCCYTQNSCCGCGNGF